MRGRRLGYRTGSANWHALDFPTSRRVLLLLRSHLDSWQASKISRNSISLHTAATKTSSTLISTPFTVNTVVTQFTTPFRLFILPFQVTERSESSLGSSQWLNALISTTTNGSCVACRIAVYEQADPLRSLPSLIVRSVMLICIKRTFKSVNITQFAFFTLARSVPQSYSRQFNCKLFRQASQLCAFLDRAPFYCRRSHQKPPSSTSWRNNFTLSWRINISRRLNRLRVCRMGEEKAEPEVGI